MGRIRELTDKPLPIHLAERLTHITDAPLAGMGSYEFVALIKPHVANLPFAAVPEHSLFINVILVAVLLP